jgi:integrase/recombinase XerD
LPYSDIKGDFISYTRQKTKRTETNEILQVPLSDSLREIIIALGNSDKTHSNYVFPILTKSENDFLKIENTVLQKIKITNKWLKSLCEDNKLPVMTTYWSRHTYASLLKNSGVAVEMIRELLGHSEIKTTEHYLKRFDIDQKRKVNEDLSKLVNG